MKIDSHADYLASVPPAARDALKSIQAAVEAAVPSASRCISYKMPAYRDGHVFIYFASFKRHIGVYPPVMDDAPLIKALEPYRGSKGNLAFPLNQPLPLPLIRRVAIALHMGYADRP